MPHLALFRPINSQKKNTGFAKQWRSGPLVLRFNPTAIQKSLQIDSTKDVKAVWIVRKKSGSAVLRNTLKRKIRESLFFRLKSGLPNGFYLWILDKEPYRESIKDFQKNLDNLWQTAESFLKKVNEKSG